MHLPCFSKKRMFKRLARRLYNPLKFGWIDNFDIAMKIYEFYKYGHYL